MPAPATLVHMTSTTTGTGSLTVAAVNGKQAFGTAFGTGSTTDVFDYFISNQGAAEWERGTGHMSNSTTLVRDTVKESTNSNALVNFSAGTKDVCNDVAPNRQDQVFDALAATGMQINGSMDIDQANAGASVTLASGTASYITDMWQAKMVRTATLATAAQQIAPPGSPSFQSAFQNCLQIKATTGLGILLTGDYAYLEHLIEGYRVQRLNFGNSGAAPVTIGFWVYATISGTMTVALLNSAANRSIPVNVTINNATTWEYKTVTFLGDTTGTWLYTTGTGLRIRFCFASGATFQGTNNTWTASEVFATSSTTDFMATTNNVACITGVVVVPGLEAPSAARSPFILRPFDLEMSFCRRFFQQLGKGSAGSGDYFIMGLCVSSTDCRYPITISPMQANPALSMSAVTDWQNGTISGQGAGSALTNLGGDTGHIYFLLNNSGSNAGTGGQACFMGAVNTNARMFLNARLT